MTCDNIDFVSNFAHFNSYRRQNRICEFYNPKELITFGGDGDLDLKIKKQLKIIFQTEKKKT